MYPFPVARAHHGSSNPEANDLNPARWVVNLRPRICHLLFVLRIHDRDCEHCYPRDSCGYEMRQGLQELNGLTQRAAPNDGDQEEMARVLECLNAMCLPVIGFVLAGFGFGHRIIRKTRARSALPLSALFRCTVLSVLAFTLSCGGGGEVPTEAVALRRATTPSR
jgi:hypothetical protein